MKQIDICFLLFLSFAKNEFNEGYIKIVLIIGIIFIIMITFVVAEFYILFFDILFFYIISFLFYEIILILQVYFELVFVEVQ